MESDQFKDKQYSGFIKIKMDQIYRYNPQGQYPKKNVDLFSMDQLSTWSVIKLLVRRLQSRLWVGKKNYYPLETAIIYQGVQVFHRADLNGAGTVVGEDYLRVLHLLGVSNVNRCFELCSGPGYIGYNLLANAVCSKLTLADINPWAVECLQYTREFNKLGDLVNIYQSDVLNSIPTTESWDLVVGNPPHFNTQADGSVRELRVHTNIDIIANDLDWKLHKQFYGNVKKYMKKDGLIVMMENGNGSTVDVFLPMIKEGGGKFVCVMDGTDIRGYSNQMYYVVSKW